MNAKTDSTANESLYSEIIDMSTPLETGFLSFMLVFDGSATPALVRRPLSLSREGMIHPGSLPDGLFLAGGFSSLLPEASEPISPTLQVNGDLGNFSDEQLTALARAELDRVTAIRFTSRLREADPRVTVLGGSASELSAFEETYGGVLDCTLLLAGSSHPEMQGANDLRITPEDDLLRVEFSFPCPIDPSRCSYCGNCAAVCGEQCIDEHLLLDASRCTMCGECVKACPTRAIDLHGQEHRCLHTPALLVLDDPLPDSLPDSPRVYRKGELARLFHSIGTVRIDETVTCSPSLCQYNGQTDKGCDRCVQACNHGAINRCRDGIKVDPIRCVECGRCVAVCPTGAMQLNRLTDASFLAYINKLSLDPGTTVVIGTETDLHGFWWRHRNRQYRKTFFLVHPTPASLGSMQLLLLACTGMSRILLISRDDTPGKPLVQVNTILKSLFFTPPLIEQLQPEMLAKALSRLSTQTGLTVPVDQVLSNRRGKLADLLVHLFKIKEKNSDLPADLFDDFGRLECDAASCSLCLACVGICATGALLADEKQFTLGHTPSLCTACGQCRDLCPENALSLKPGLQLLEDFFRENLLARATPAACPECGKIFGTRESLDRVRAMLKVQGMADRESMLLAYCGECRVRKLFEAGTP